ncbi:MAG: hypothetical protein KAI81_02600, partial [Candidatus Marinimicrobia bacterium]|nr:hypothetical protein [Candidatus Neomarinimicrobiota bacterium]
NNLTSESTKSKLDQFLEDLNKLSREENQEKVELILDNLNILLDENSNHISLFIEDMSRFSSNLITVSDQFSIFVGKLDKQAEKTGFQMDTLMTNLNILSKQLVDADIPVLVHNVNDAVTIIKTTTDHVDLTVMNGRQDLLVLLATLRDATENLNEFSRQISNDPSLLLRQKK